MTETITDPAFRKLVSLLGQDVTPSSPTSVEFLFDDDLPLRLSLHPNAQEVVVDGFAYDASALSGPRQAVILDLLLRLNAFGVRGRFFAIGIDPRGFVAVTTRAPLAGVDRAALLDLIDYVTEQARRVRTLMSSLAPAEQTQTYSLVQ
jgi:hypothetical protein